MTMGSQTDFPTSEHQQISAFSALNLLKNYNEFLNPTGTNLVQMYHHYACGTSFSDFPPEHISPSGCFPFNPSAGSFIAYPNYDVPSSPSPLSSMKSRHTSLSLPSLYSKRPRGEKKPIPDDQKDDRYYERRKRNNQAAKKSRDARKFREDQIALKATLLEHENALLKAQVLTLREETQSLRQYILKERATMVPGKFLYGKTAPEVVAAATNS